MTSGLTSNHVQSMCCNDILVCRNGILESSFTDGTTFSREFKDAIFAVSTQLLSVVSE
jgi:hypothetical protein